MKCKSKVAALAAAVLAFAANAQDASGTDTSTVRNAARSAISSAVSTGKNLFTGITEGVTKGRDSAQGSDGALTASDYSQIKGKVEIQVLALEKQDQQWIATIGFKNSSAKQLRLINLRVAGSLIAIDKSGYANPLVDGLANPDQITIPANAGIRQKFVFDASTDQLTAVRLWGHEVAIAASMKN